MIPEKYPGIYLKTEPFDIRYKIVADYFARNGNVTVGKVIIDLNCGEPRFKRYIPYRKYYANDVYIPDDVTGIEFSKITDEQVDEKADILCCFGYGGGEFTNHPLESRTADKSIYRLAKYNPEYIVLEMAQKWENDFHIMSNLIKNLTDYKVVLEKKYQIPPANHYHDIRQVTILKRDTHG